MDFQIETIQEGDDRVFEVRSEDSVLGKLRCRWRKRVTISQIEINEDHRKEGLGSALMHELVKQALSEKIDCIECHISQPAEDEEDDVAYFLWRCGFTPWLFEDGMIRYVLWMWNDDTTTGETAPSPDVLDSDDDPDAADDLDPEDLEQYLNHDANEASDNGISEKKSALHESPQIDPMGPEDMICKRCLYRLDGPNAGECHKYFYKPDSVFTEDKCEFYVG